jgi:zinc D-Ala-D-Ala carboxypeptidase
MSKFKYFTDEEVVGIKDDVIYKLDRARSYFEAPIIITCGYRTPEHNAEIGGVPDSAHTKGLAVDIEAPAGAFAREKLAWALARAGFERVESAPKHFHVDVDPTKPAPAFWVGTDH